MHTSCVYTCPTYKYPYTSAEKMLAGYTNFLHAVAGQSIMGSTRAGVEAEQLPGSHCSPLPGSLRQDGSQIQTPTCRTIAYYYRGLNNYQYHFSGDSLLQL